MKLGNIAVFIGRFQPLHDEHIYLIKETLKTFDKLIILVGSSNLSISLKNPFSYEERKDFISIAFSKEIQEGKIKIAPIKDFYSDADWISHVQTTIESLVHPRNKNNICIVGYSKDESAYYLKLFKEYGFMEIEPRNSKISSTDIRLDMYSISLKNPDYNILPFSINQALVDKVNSVFKSHWKNYLKTEYIAITEYKKSWEGCPYPSIFVTADVLVQHQNKLLLVQRKSPPGKNKFALPGGFVNQSETIIESAKRECFEETGINLKSFSPKTSAVFDHPNRSSRGRVITHCFYFDITMNKSLENVEKEVIAGDDASVAGFFDIQNLPMSTCFHDDHYQIIETILCKTNQLNLLRW